MVVPVDSHLVAWAEEQQRRLEQLKQRGREAEEQAERQRSFAESWANQRPPVMGLEARKGTELIERLEKQKQLKATEVMQVAVQHRCSTSKSKDAELELQEPPLLALEAWSEARLKRHQQRLQMEVDAQTDAHATKKVSSGATGGTDTRVICGNLSGNSVQIKLQRMRQAGSARRQVQLVALQRFADLKNVPQPP
mmetsp:Transcript_58383/g.103821  ORF Transcript_58383/g.103821 Transcript_58383/m.103821 type:complete len:195 (+) Transcript_58383:51-635(+)